MVPVSLILLTSECYNFGTRATVRSLYFDSLILPCYVMLYLELHRITRATVWESKNRMMSLVMTMNMMLTGSV